MSKMVHERNEIREMTLAAAIEELAKARRHLFDLRLQKARDEVKDVREFAKTRKRIARLMFKIHSETRLPHAPEVVDEEDLAEETESESEE
jgi:ribosomal protein L29